MPTYDYFCEHCGDFAVIRPISARNQPYACPHCGASAYRVMIGAPTLATLDTPTRSAHATNERARHAPMTSAEYHNSGRHRHGPGCGCCGGSPSQKNTYRTADGAKAFPTKRPWMISH